MLITGEDAVLICKPVSSIYSKQIVNSNQRTNHLNIKAVVQIGKIDQSGSIVFVKADTTSMLVPVVGNRMQLFPEIFLPAKLGWFQFRSY